MIYNSYENDTARKNRWKVLPEVNNTDKIIWRKLLGSRYRVIELDDVDDIALAIKSVHSDFAKWQLEVGNKKIHRLHFNFSGHGIYNQSINVDVAKHGNASHGTSDTQFGPCLVGNTGDKELYSSVLEIKSLLTQFNADFITLTLDCCRELDNVAESRSRLPVKLTALPKIDNDDSRKIATIYTTCTTDWAYDGRFCRELKNVIHSSKDHRVRIDQIVGLVNKAWEPWNKNHPDQTQYCYDEMVRIDGGHWERQYFPL